MGRFAKNGELSSRRKLFLGAAACLLSGLAILAAASRFIETSEPHLSGALNDQIAYINIGRSLETKHQLRSYVVLPATLWRKNISDVLYMPGHPATLALSYKLFGFGARQSILPSLVSYLVAMLAIYFIGVRLYTPAVGFVASLFFALFPPTIFFAFTAMSELTFVAAFTAAVCACLYLPRRLRPWLGPICLAIPFLFRETAAFMVIPLGLWFWLDPQDKRWRALVFVALSVILFGALYRADFAARRPSMLKAHIFGDAHAMYDDAPAQQAASNPTWQDWKRVLPSRTLDNIKGLFVNPEFVPGTAGATYILMAAILLVLLAAVVNGDRFAWSVTILNVTVLAITLIFVSETGYRGVRYLLFGYALNIIVVASLLATLVRRLAAPVHSRLQRWAIVTAAGVTAAVILSVLSLGAVKNMYAFFANQDVVDRRVAATLESIDIDRNRMLVTPFECTRYRFDHFPVSWSMLPYNLPTLDLLATRFDIGTMIVPYGHPLLKDPAAIESFGFHEAQIFSMDHDVYVVYKRPDRINAGGK